MDQSIEKWLPVVGYEGQYEVSDHGQVRSMDRINFRGRRTRGRTLKTGKKMSGHLLVALCRNNAKTTKYVHSIVLESFLGPRPDGMEACHNDGNPGNNNVSNLRWDTRSANTHDQVRHGRHNMTSRTACPLGHPLELPNLSAVDAKRGKRSCRACTLTRSYANKNQIIITQGLADIYYQRIISGEFS